MTGLLSSNAVLKSWRFLLCSCKLILNLPLKSKDPARRYSPFDFRVGRSTSPCIPALRSSSPSGKASKTTPEMQFSLLCSLESKCTDLGIDRGFSTGPYLDIMPCCFPVYKNVTRKKSGAAKFIVPYCKLPKGSVLEETVVDIENMSENRILSVLSA